MSRRIVTGIDVGTYQVKVLVVEEGGKTDVEKQAPRVLGTGLSESQGLRHGYILNRDEARKSIHDALAKASNASGIKIKRALVSVGGIGLGSIMASASIMTSRADYEITDLDLKKAIGASQNDIPQSFALNRKIIHTVPIHFKVDGKLVLGRPEGMKGLKLEVKTLFTTCLEHHLDDLVDAVEEAGVEVGEIIAAPLAAALVSLTKTQKIAGVVLANIGSETASIVVFENGVPISLEIFPIGGSDITNDIALGLHIPLEEAEDVKRGTLVGMTYPKKKLEEIVAARLSDIFDLIEAHLKKIGRSGLLPAGIVMTGGSSGIETIEDLAKAALHLPSKVSPGRIFENAGGRVKDATWSVAYGLCLIGLSEKNELPLGIRLAYKARNDVIEWLKQFLP